ncbi:MAG TPA: TonB-dependent receptor [Caulobacteraceae bacterium]|nr:TonB-dependent receptor [Caulobacteraceae bacterium]
MGYRANRRIARPILASLGAVALAGLFTPAMAAEATSDTAAASAGGGVEVETIIVTARRREENLQTAPVSVTAVSPTQLKNAAAVDIRDLAGRAPDLVIDPVNAGPSAAAISIRGISFEDIEKSFDPAVGVLIDDVYIGTNTGQLTDTFDLASVQVLRGPQGTLFGRNTIGGVVSLQRTRPTGEFGGQVDVIVGDYGRQEYKGVLNLPKIGDVLSTKLFVSERKSDGYMQNVTLNQRTPGSDVLRFGGAFLIQPTSNFDLNLTLEHSRERSHNDQAPLSASTDLICAQLPFGPGGSLIYLGPPFQPPASECNRGTGADLYTTFSNKLGVLNNDENDITAQANWRLGGVTLTSITGYRRNKEHAVQDFDSVSIDFFDTVRDQIYHQVSQEFRLSGKVTDAADFVVGAYYFDSHYSLDQATNYGLLLQAAAGLPAQGRQQVEHNSRSYAVFGDVDWTFAPNWRLSVGGRYTRDEKHLDNSYPGVFATSAGASWGQFTPRASIDWRPTSDVMLYASYSRGFRSGGFNGRSATPISSTTPYNPEKVDAYEAGAKTSWLDHRLVLNASVFDTEYKDKQEEVVVPVTSGGANAQETLVANAAQARIYGAEFELQAQPTRELSLRASLGLLHAQYGRFLQVDATYPTLNDDMSNLTLRRAPKVTADVGFDYRMPVSFGTVSLSADYRYIGAHETVITPAPGTGVYTGAGCPTTNCTYIAPINDPRGHAVASNLIDASLGFEHPIGDRNVRIAVFGRNLLDERHLAGALAVAGLFSFGTGIPPRTWGVELSAKF